jgi:peptide/nickel transport system substrate-binding protein
MNGFTRTLAALLCAISLAACTKTASVSNGKNAWTIPGVVRLGKSEEPDSLNLMFGHTAATDEMDSLLFSSLLRFDDNGNYFPDLATQVPTVHNGGISKDQKTITLHLRKDAKWSDGMPVTSADWIFTYHAVLNPANNTKTRYGWDEIESANAPDPYTIVIHMKRPSVAVLGILAMGGAAYPPLPAHVLAKLPDINRAPFNSKPISSGPFVLKEWSHGSTLTFVPNPYYFRGVPKIKEIVWKVLPDENTQLNQLKTHEIDVYPTADENSIPKLATIPGVRVEKRLLANWRHLGINASRPHLNDVRVRQAIAEGVDWKRINDTVYHGYNQLGVSDIFPGSWAAPKLPPYRYDPDHAKQLLAAAGWTKGSDGVLHKGPLAMHLTISATTSAKSNEQSEVVIQSMLRALGIDVQIRNYPPSLMFSQTGPLYSGKYDLEWSVETNGPDPENKGSWNSNFIPPHGANTSWLRDTIVDQTSEDASSTFDEARRRELYQKEEARLRELVPAVFFYWETGYYAVNTDLKNFKPAAFLADTWNAWEWQI